jgi:hypothetical protein
MATRSTIAVEHADGTVSQVYCHWDGYLSHNGQILVDHYDTQEKAEQLVSFGSMGSLRPKCIPDPAKTHSSINPQDDVTTYYGRDNGEPFVVPSLYPTVDNYKRNLQCEEYDYLFTEGQWEVSNGRGYELVAQALEVAKLKETDER